MTDENAINDTVADAILDCLVCEVQRRSINLQQERTMTPDKQTKLFSINSNIPGCMPDTEAELFLEFNDARQCLIEAIMAYNEEHPNWEIEGEPEASIEAVKCNEEAPFIAMFHGRAFCLDSVPVEPEDERRIAVAMSVDCSISEANDAKYGGGEYVEADGGEYRVMTDSEANEAWDESLDSYIDDFIIPEIGNDTLKQYFDIESWKQDARYDGRGHCLNCYDGSEECETVNGIDYYVYRTN